MALSEWQNRVVVEMRELDERRAKLAAFMCSMNFRCLDVVDRGLLDEQSAHMAAYSATLQKRIASFARFA